MAVEAVYGELVSPARSLMTRENAGKSESRAEELKDFNADEY
jgi:hypothetical protein